MTMCKKHKGREALHGRVYCGDCIARRKKRREHLISQGLCRCGNPLAEGRKNCRGCLEKATRIRESTKKQGLCLCKKAFVVAGRKKCVDCLAHRNARNAKKRNSGLCQCGGAPEAGRRKCDTCLYEAKKRRLDFRNQGLCGCGKGVIDNLASCPSCVAKGISRRKRNQAAGNCLCGRPRMEGKKVCQRCVTLRNNRYIIMSRTNLKFISTKAIRSAVGEAIKRVEKAKKTDRTEVLLGCTIAFARKHIESQFLPGMSWENRSLWQIDHYIPCNAFDLSDERQQRLCNNWRNLRPLWTEHNRSKWFSLPDDYSVRLAELEKHVSYFNDPIFC